MKGPPVPALQKLKQNCYAFEASLGCVVSFRPSWANKKAKQKYIEIGPYYQSRKTRKEQKRGRQPLYLTDGAL